MTFFVMKRTEDSLILAEDIAQGLEFKSELISEFVLDLVSASPTNNELARDVRDALNDYLADYGEEVTTTSTAEQEAARVIIDAFNKLYPAVQTVADAVKKANERG